MKNSSPTKGRTAADERWARQFKTTHDEAVSVLDAELAAARKKTDRLRQLRLEKQAAEVPVAKPAKRRSGRPKKSLKPEELNAENDG